MANWTGLAGAAGLAAALEGIQDRRIREAQLQRELTKDQGEWLPASGGMGGPLGFFDALLGYNKPGQIGFGGQRYQFQPHPKMTEEDVRGLGLTMPQTTTTPAYEKPLPPDVQGPLELVPEQTTTRDVPLPGFVGQRLDPKTRQALALERFKEHRDLAKLKEEYRLAGMGLEPGGAGATDMSTPAFKIPGMEEPTGAGATGTPGTPGAPAIGTVAPTTPAAGAKIPLGTPTKEMEDAIAEAHRLYPQVRPELIRAIMARESNFDPKLVSPKGAKGLMGLMPDTQKELGVKDPFNIMESTIGGTRYFAQQLTKYGSEELALAAYNAGPGRVDKDGKTIPKIKETQAYVPWVLEHAKPDAFKPAAVPQVQAQVPASATGGTGMQVAGGTGAPAPPTTQPVPTTPPTTTPPTTTKQSPALTTATGPSGTTATVPSTTTAQPGPQPPAAGPYKPSDALVAQVNNNRQKIAANDQRIIQIEQERRMAQVQTRRGMPGAVDRLRMYSDQAESLRKQNLVLNKESEDAYAKEYGIWQQRQEKRQDEAVKPAVSGDVKAAEMNVTTDPELRNLTRDLADKGIVGNADYNKNSEPDKAIVIRTAKKYADNKALVENLDGFSKAALSQILKEDNTPMGEVSTEQLTRARAQGAARIRQQKDDEIEAGRLAKLNEPMKEFALKYFHPKLLRVADGTMTAPEAEKAGYRLMPVENQKTMMAADNSISSINRVYTLLFGGDDPDGSITGTVGQKFDGIYPTLEKGRTDTQSAIARTKMTMQLKKGIFQGTDIGQSASALQKYIQGTLGALSRDLGGERGHFTDFDARRIQGLFQDLQTGMFAVGPMTSSGEAKKLMRSIVATISDRVRTSGSLRRDDPLPWNVSGERRREPQAGVPATGTAQEPVRTPPVAQETVPTPPAAQEPAPAPVAPTSQRPNAPAAAQPDARLKQLEGHPPEYPGQQVQDKVTGIIYQHNGTTWVPMPSGGK